MRHLLRCFARTETGAITVDWVVMTAGIVGLAGASALVMGDGVITAASNTGAVVDARQVANPD